MPVRIEFISDAEWEQLQMAVRARLGEFRTLVAEGLDESVTESDRAWVIKTHETMFTLVKKIEEATTLNRENHPIIAASLS